MQGTLQDGDMDQTQTNLARQNGQREDSYLFYSQVELSATSILGLAISSVKEASITLHGFLAGGSISV